MKIAYALMVAFVALAFVGSASAQIKLGEDDLVVREFVKAARAAYPTEAYQSYTNTLVRDKRWGKEWRYNFFHDVPKGGRVSKCETTNDVRWVNVPGLRNVRGLRARGDYTVDLAWKNGELTSRRILGSARSPGYVIVESKKEVYK